LKLIRSAALTLVSYPALLAQSTLAPAATGATTVQPGAQVPMSVTYCPQGACPTPAQPAALGFTATLPPFVTALTATPGAALSGLGKTLQFGNFVNGALQMLVVGQNQTIIPPGTVVASLVATVGSTPGSGPVCLTNTVGVDGLISTNNPPSGARVITTSPGACFTLTIAPPPNKCDVLGQGSVTTADAVAEASWILGTTTPPPGQSADRGFGLAFPNSILNVVVVYLAAGGLPCFASL
jgi:hypothetical protein